MDIFEKSLNLHSASQGKLSVESKQKLDNYEDLSLQYTPGVAAACKAIKEDKSNLGKLTIKANTVAVVTNGTAVLGLGDIGPEAALPVMEGKCVLFKKFAGINAFPVCIDTKNADEFVEIVKKTSIPFAGINLEDIAAPLCFEIENRLKAELDIPVFHDDQHGTAIVVLAGLINALKVVNKNFKDANIVILGAGAAGSAITRLLLQYGFDSVTVCDRKGVIKKTRSDIADDGYKYKLANVTKPRDDLNTLDDALNGADVFIGVSGPGLLNEAQVKLMNNDAIVFALANPVPEIMPNEALNAGAAIVGTGRSDFPNQINNVLAFPGIFKGAIESGKKRITDNMMLSAAKSLAALIKNPKKDNIIPQIFDKNVVVAVSEAVKSI